MKNLSVLSLCLQNTGYLFRRILSIIILTSYTLMRESDDAHVFIFQGYVSPTNNLSQFPCLMTSFNLCPLLLSAGYLDRDTVNLFWTPVQATIGQVSKKRKGMSFGLGWQLMHKKASFGCCGGGAKFAAMHTGMCQIT